MGFIKYEKIRVKYKENNILNIANKQENKREN